MFNRLFYFIQPARGGKSTICKRWETYEEFQETNLIPLNYGLNVPDCKPNPRVVVNADSVRLALHGKVFDKDREEEVWHIKYTMVRHHLLRGCDVLIDGTSTTRRSWWDIFKIRSDATPIFVGTDQKTCKERAISSGHTWLVDKGVIDRMFGNMRDVWAKYAPNKEFDLNDYVTWNMIVNSVRQEFLSNKKNEVSTSDESNS